MRSGGSERETDLNPERVILVDNEEHRQFGEKNRRVLISARSQGRLKEKGEVKERLN